MKEIHMTRSRENSDMSTYALRYVRYLLLKRLCNSNHTVVSVERHLLEQAASSVRKRGMDERFVTSTIKKMVIGRILNLSEDQEVQSSLLEEVEREDFADLRERH